MSHVCCLCGREASWRINYRQDGIDASTLVLCAPHACAFHRQARPLTNAAISHFEQTIAYRGGKPALVYQPSAAGQ